jgi:hypothetical protein
MKTKSKNLFMDSRWEPDTQTNWPTDHRSRYNLKLETDYFFLESSYALRHWDWTQPVTEMSAKNLPEVKGYRPALKADNLTAICDPTV